MYKTICALLLIPIFFCTRSALATWELNNGQSSLNFISVKMSHIGEVHTFKKLAGTLDDTGKVSVSIDLTSVDTHIPVRDERMRELLFETGQYPKAVLTTQLDMEKINGVAKGGMQSYALTAKLNLHGEEKQLALSLVIVRLDDGKLLVVSREPVLIHASAYSLVAGIERLRKIAGLPAISQAVPVNFTLLFEKNK